ncbi:MAG: 4-alpha-glucanotransferase [Dehalococcoidales bacterium]|nr:4-alpha-glucanotransferase [Dehalococcoidales bacterium]
MNFSSGSRSLHHLASLHGIQSAYYDVKRRRQHAPVESLLTVLQSLGAPITGLQDVPFALRQRCQELWQMIVEPVLIAWDDIPFSIRVRLPSSLSEALLGCHIEMEGGEEMNWRQPGTEMPVLEHSEIEGIGYVVKQLGVPVRLPWGYHRFTICLEGNHAESLIVSAPRRAYVPGGKENAGMWGAFLPLYALHREGSWGGGDYSDLEALVEWLAETGGDVVATLPLLATFLDGICEPSPYLPASRQLWNEFYLDVNRIPDLPKCSSAQAILKSAAFEKEVAALRRLPLVDYRRQMALKRVVLEELCRFFFAESSGRLGDFQHFVDTNPVVENYARFRAAMERQGTSWRFWPEPMRSGIIRDNDYDEENRRYHLYVQWLAHQQIQHIAEEIEDRNMKLYLDLPLGVHPDSYDVWHNQDAFVSGVSVGAPPDNVFTNGQDWGFPPLHPQRIREEGYRYIVACLRHNLRYAGVLRIDHVMGLHRLFCIPHGIGPGQGVYVRYRAEEFYAILSLESHRNRATIVGEDLGTVPSYIRPAMGRHNFSRMYILHYELAADSPKGLHPVSSSAVASLNTHDMPPFASLWQGLDIEERSKLGLLDSAGVKSEQDKLLRMKEALVSILKDSGWLCGSDDDIHAIIKSSLSFLAASKARIVVVNLEDLWLEIQQQNIPGTTVEYPNWRHRSRYALGQFCQLSQVVDTLLTVDQIRKRRKYR